MENMTFAKTKKTSALKNMLNGLTALFSAVVEEELTNKQTLLILNAITATLVTVFAVGMPLWFTGVSLIWMIHSLHLCKKAGLGEKEEEAND